MKKILAHVLIGISMMTILFSALTPAYVSFAEESSKSNPKECTDGKECGPIISCTGNNCDFKSFMKLINNVINFLLFEIAPIFATIAISWGGFLILTSGGNPSKITTAKKMMWNIFIGYIIALAAWLIVKFIFAKDIVEDKFLFFIE